MTRNVGMADRFVRLLLGGGLLYWAIFLPDTPYSVIGWVGLIVVATGLVGWCGLYKLLGISSLPEGDR